jgi:hypothetical protein
MLDEFGAEIENAESKLDATMRKMVKTKTESFNVLKRLLMYLNVVNLSSEIFKRLLNFVKCLLVSLNVVKRR